MVSKNKKWSWGMPEDAFPTGMWDDFDGSVAFMEYEEGDYNTQIHFMIRPEDYEYEARNLDLPDDDLDLDDQKLPQEWWSMGGDGDTYKISSDGMDIESGPPPTKNTRAYKGVMAFRNKAKVKLDSMNIEPLVGQVVHWGITTEKYRNRDTGERGERNVLYPTGPAVGEAVYGKAKSGSRRDRRNEDSNGDSGEESTQETRETRRPAGRRPARRAASRKSQDDEVETQGVEESSDSSSPNGEVSEAVKNLVLLVEGRGDKGARANRLAGLIAAEEDDLIDQLGEEKGSQMVEEMAKRSTLQEAVEAGLLVDEEGVIKVAS